MAQPVGPELITGIVSFLLNSAVLSSFIIPQAQRLKEIKDQLLKFKLPGETLAAWMPKPTPESSNLDTDEVARLQTILDIYQLRFNELKPFYWYFLVSILVVLATLGVATLLPDWAQLALAMNPVAQLLILLLSVRQYTVRPGQLSSAPYLVRACEINPHLLSRAMGLAVYFRPSDPSKYISAREQPLSIVLTFRLRIHGFRFVLIVADQGGTARFVSIGPMAERTTYFRHLLDQRFDFREHNELEIGRFPLNAIPGRHSTITLLVFMPLLSVDELSPMIGSVRFDGGTERPELISGHSGFGGLRPDRVYRGAQYQGLGTKLRSLVISKSTEEREEPIASVLERFHDEIMRTRVIRQHQL